MKKILLPLLLMIGFGAMAQDMAISTIRPATETKIKPNKQMSVALGLTVVTQINAGTQFTIEYAWDNAAFTAIGGTLSFNQTAAAGTNVNIPGLNVTSPDGSDGDSVDLTFRILSAADTNMNNNAITATYILSEVLDKDLEVSITSPLPNSEVKNWSTLPVTASITNVGNDVFPTGANMIFVLLINNQAQGQATIQQYSGSPLSTGESGQVSFNINIPRNFIVGPISLCVVYNWAEVSGNTATTIETDLSNNRGCVDLTGVINSINDDFMQVSSLNYNFGKLNINLFNKEKVSNYQFVINSITGQQIKSETVNLPINSQSSHQLDMNGAASGVYLLNIYANGEMIGTEKFMVR